jgi:hypothetical protein
MNKPYVGAILVYNDLLNNPNPAIVNAVNADGTVAITEFNPAGHTAYRPKVALGPDIGQCDWPVVPDPSGAVSPEETAIANAKEDLETAIAKLKATLAKAKAKAAEPKPVVEPAQSNPSAAIVPAGSASAGPQSNT